MRCAASCSLACIRWTCTTSLSRRTAGGAGPSSLSSSRVTRLLSHRMLQHGWLHVLACGLLPGCMPPVCLWHVVRGTAGSVGLSSSSTDRLRLRRQLLSARQCPHVVTESHQWYLSTNVPAAHCLHAPMPLVPARHGSSQSTELHLMRSQTAPRPLRPIAGYNFGPALEPEGTVRVVRHATERSAAQGSSPSAGARR